MNALRLPVHEAEVAQAQHIRVPGRPSPYSGARRGDAAPHTLPAAIIHGPYIPIKDRGPETNVTTEGGYGPRDPRDEEKP
jgi:hypothetical protein